MGQRQGLARLQRQLVLSQQQAAFLESEKRTLSDELTGLQGERKGLEQRVDRASIKSSEEASRVMVKMADLSERLVRLEARS